MSTLCAVLTALQPCATMAAPIPLNLSRPDGAPVNMTKKVKVYILAGQSNMVGMGDIGGARPLYPSIFLSADPAIIPGVMPIGGSALAAHGVYQSADANAVKGANASIYRGAYDPKADYAKLTPVKTATIDLGTVSKNLPAVDGPHTVVVKAAIDVPATGNYTVHAGFEESTYSVVTLDGKEVYRKDIGGKPVIAKIALETGKRYPVTITYFKGGSAAFWLEQVDLEGKGDLETVTKKDRKFTCLLDDAGKWSVRNDVVYTDPRLFPNRAVAPLSATANNGKSIGPEVGFGYVMGAFHDEQVLLIKTAMGNRSLGFDFRPPSSGRTDVSNEFEGVEYRLMVKGVRETLDKIDKIVPGYQGQGYEIAGFGWFQGHKDSGSSKEAYEKNLVNLINDLRKEFKAPKMPVVVATVGFHGYELLKGPWKGVWEAQMAVGDPTQHPEFAGTAASVDTRDFWREVDESPRAQDFHYNRNAETYLLVGEAMGRAMVGLQGGKAEAIPKSDREARTAARVAAEAAKPVPTEQQKAASLAALKPMILDGALASFVNNPQYLSSLQAAVKAAKPEKVSPYLDDTLDEAVAYYQKAGIKDYDWKPFGGDLKGATWEYFCFDLPDKTKGISDLKAACPVGLENWYAPDFDAKKAGWQSGAAPFGVKKDPIKYPEWYGPSKRTPPTTVCEKDVLLLRQTFTLPPLKDDRRYRIRVGGSVHANSGEGYAIYVNGKLLAESKAGIVAWRKEGRKPRGSHVWADFRGEFKGGKVTIAVSNFPMNNRTGEGFLPASRDPLGVWIEEQKIPLARAAGESPDVVFMQDREAKLLSAIAALKDHIQGSNTLDATQIEAQKLVIDTQRDIFGSNAALIKAACNLVAAYDKVNGPLWVARDGFSRKGNPPANDIHWTVFNVMQNIMDNVYTAENIARYEKLLTGFKFGCSEHFPGPVEPPADPAAVYTVKINGSYLMPFKHDILGKSLPARRPTGAYAPPGAIVTVTVPPALAGKGYQVRIGAHSWDHKAKPNVKRLDRVSLVYAISNAEVKVASPLGGGIYIEVPLGADAGVVDVTIRNAARSPFFSTTSYHKTSQAEWRDSERNRKAPWADFQSDKFLMQVPAIWIRKLDDPVTLMNDWDKAMDAATDLMGLPNVWGREVAYLQVDLQNRGSAFFPGYPTCNNGYDPNKDYGGYADNYLVRGPKFAPDYVFHEMGHGFLFTKFDGETESTVNLLHVAVWNGMFGCDLDEAFRSSFGGGNTNQTLDTTAIQWMTSLSFAAKRPMVQAEKAYQLKGHAKFVDIARLFGWKALGTFWKYFIEDDEKDVSKGRRGYNNDELSLRLSRAAGADLTPLLCFWGTPPDDAKALKAAVADAKLPPSAKVYDTLEHYKSLVPADNKAFRDFALKWWGKQPSEKGFWTEREHAKQWKEYDEKTAAAIRDAVEAILAKYFPGGRPAEQAK